MSFIKNLFLSDKVILSLISVNALIIFLQGFPLDTVSAETHRICMIIDDIISLLFVIEVIIKSKHYGLKEYLKPAWNKFDVFLILLSLPPLFLNFLPGAIASNFGVLLIFRVFRVFKFFRFIQFFPQVEPIFNSIRIAMKASFVVLVSFFLCIFIMSILSCYFYQNVAPEYFRDPIVAYYSMFKVFTIEGWNAIPDEIAASGKLGSIGAFFTKLYFGVILVFGGVIGLSIVNSIFVDAMVSDNNDDLEAQVNRLETEVQQLNTKLDQLITILEKDKVK